MIELLNGLQNGTGGEGLDKLMANSSSKNPLEAKQFQELLSKAQTSENPQASLENLLTQKQQSAKELAVLDSSDELAQKLLGQDSSEELVLEATLEQEGQVLPEQVLKNSTKAQTQESPLASVLGKQATPLKTSGELRMTTSSAQMDNLELPVLTDKLQSQNQILGQAPKGALKDMLASTRGEDGQEFIDPRFGPNLTQLSAKKSVKPNATTQLQYSEDFITQKIESSGDGTPKVTGAKSALNLFEKEHSVLNDSGLFNKKNFNKMSVENTSFDSSATEKISSTIDQSANFNESLVASGSGVTGVKKELTDVSLTSSTDVKAIDLSNIDNPEKLLKEISNYIENSRIQNGKELEVLVKHKDLGNFKVNATKSGGGMIDLQITAASDEAHAFFSKNEVNLLKALNSSGLKISDFKLASADTSSSNSNGNNSADQNSSGNGQGFGRQSNSENSHQQGRQRRQELWDDYRQKLGA